MGEKGFGKTVNPFTAGTFVPGDPRAKAANQKAQESPDSGFPKELWYKEGNTAWDNPNVKETQFGGPRASATSQQGIDARHPETWVRPMDIIHGAPHVKKGQMMEFKSFAQKIRARTKDGWELVDAVYEVFCRARANQADALIIESATWLADRGFGKPVQVGQLLDAEGNAVAFTLWSPATQEPIGDVITIQDGKVVDDATGQPYSPPQAALEEPKPYEPPAKDGYADGVARAWSSSKESVVKE